MLSYCAGEPTLGKEAEPTGDELAEENKPTEAIEEKTVPENSTLDRDEMDSDAKPEKSKKGKSKKNKQEKEEKEVELTKEDANRVNDVAEELPVSKEPAEKPDLEDGKRNKKPKKGCCIACRLVLIKTRKFFVPREWQEG